jgi:hypothetical protein
MWGCRLLNTPLQNVELSVHAKATLVGLLCTLYIAYDTSFITCQDQSRFCEKPSQNYIRDQEVANNRTKTLDNLVIYQLNIIKIINVYKTNNTFVEINMI